MTAAEEKRIREELVLSDEYLQANGLSCDPVREHVRILLLELESCRTLFINIRHNIVDIAVLYEASVDGAGVLLQSLAKKLEKDISI